MYSFSWSAADVSVNALGEDGKTGVIGAIGVGGITKVDASPAEPDFTQRQMILRGTYNLHNVYIDLLCKETIEFNFNSVLRGAVQRGLWLGSRWRRPEGACRTAAALRRQQGEAARRSSQDPGQHRHGEDVKREKRKEMANILCHIYHLIVK